MATKLSVSEKGPAEAPKVENVRDRPAPLPRVKPGPELEALNAFHFDCGWEGRILAGWGSPESPEIKAKGTGNFRWIMNGLWLVGEFEQDHFIEDYKVGDWVCHYVVGWDPHSQEYTAVAVDSNGIATLLRGHIEPEAKRLILETPGEAPLRVRMTWDMQDPSRALWTNEVSEKGGPWRLVEEYVATPLGVPGESS